MEPITYFYSIVAQSGEGDILLQSGLHSLPFPATEVDLREISGMAKKKMEETHKCTIPRDPVIMSLTRV